MKPLSDQVWCVRDCGTFFTLACELNRQGVGTVLYSPDHDHSFPEIGEAVIGHKFDRVIRCDDPLRRIDQIDAFIYPDIGHVGEQLLLESLGKMVWGSRAASELESNRSDFRALQAKLGMDVPEYVLIRGITKLREHLRPLTDKFIKLNRFRRNWETKHWRSLDEDYMALVYLEANCGPFAEDLIFLVEDKIDSDLEHGGDWVIVDGKPADKGIIGVEKKDQAYTAFVRTWAELDETIKQVFEPLLPTLAEEGYRNFLSTEQRITKTHNYLIDITPRLGFPSGGCQLRLYGNLPELMQAGANGELVEVQDRASVCLEAMIEYNGPGNTWRSLKVPDEAMEWLNLLGPAQRQGIIWKPPGDNGEDCAFGSINGIGDSVEEAYRHLLHNVELLKDQPVTVRTDAFNDLLTELNQAEKSGAAQFSDEPIPEKLEAT